MLFAIASVLPAIAEPDGKGSWGRATEKQLTKTDIFVAGKGYPCYRIPSMVVMPKGTILAMSEGRQRQHDHAKNDLVLRRSTDLGKTWMPQQLVAEDGDNSLNDPSMVVDQKTGRVMVLYTRMPEGFHTAEVVPGLDGERISRSLMVYSDDEGRTWSKPRELTKQVKNPKAKATVFAPGMGTQIHFGKYKGRIIVPMWKTEPGKAYVVYSDDGGETWTSGEDMRVAGRGSVNESQVVELIDGTIMINARSCGGPLNRKVAYSKDGGATWSKLVDEPALPEPNCQASLIRLSDPRNAGALLGGKSRILYSGPALPNARANGTIRLSYDEGKTWPVGKQIEPGLFYSYSALAVLPDGSIGVLYEGNGGLRITFARFTLSWLTDGKDSIK